MEECSRLGHLLKGSSAAIGLSSMAATCEKIQYLGKCKESNLDISEEEAILKLKGQLVEALEQFNLCREFFSRLL